MVALVAAGVAAAAVPAVTHLTDFAVAQRTEQRLAQARRLHDPEGLTPLTLHRGACSGDALIRCATTSDPHVEALAAMTRASLSRATGQAATLRCSSATVPGTAVRTHLCLVQAHGGRITVSITSRTARVGRRLTVTGSDYLVQAS
jgi:hypothetical protein